MGKTVFISYASNDEAIAQQICDFLEKQDISCWIAHRDATPGQDYGEEILRGLRECSVLVLVLSEHANESVWVKREVERFVSAGKAVLPVRVREVLPTRSLELFVASSHWIDAWEPPIHQYLDRLVQAIHKAAEHAGEHPPSGGDHQRKPSRSPRTRSRWPLVAGGALVVVLAAVGAGWWWLGSDAGGGADVAAGGAGDERSEAANREPSPGPGDSMEELEAFMTLIDGTSGGRRYNAIREFADAIPAELTTNQMLAIVGNSSYRTRLLADLAPKLPRTLPVEDVLTVLQPTAGGERYHTLEIFRERLPAALSTAEVLDLIGNSSYRTRLIDALAGRLPDPLPLEDALTILAPTAGGERYKTLSIIAPRIGPGLTAAQIMELVGDSSYRDRAIQMLRSNAR